MDDFFYIWLLNETNWLPLKATLLIYISRFDQQIEFLDCSRACFAAVIF